MKDLNPMRIWRWSNLHILIYPETFTQRYHNFQNYINHILAAMNQSYLSMFSSLEVFFSIAHFQTSKDVGWWTMIVSPTSNLALFDSATTHHLCACRHPFLGFQVRFMTFSCFLFKLQTFGYVQQHHYKWN